MKRINKSSWIELEDNINNFNMVEFNNICKNLSLFKERKLIICIDLKKIDFNKLKFTNNEILEEILKNLNVENKLHTLSTSECILELN